MKIAIVIPRNGVPGEKSFFDYQFIADFLWSKKYFSYLLAVPVLLSLTPEGHDVRVFDENIEDIDYDWNADLAGISVRTMFAPRAYHIADNFRQRGTKTVLGGIHPSMCTEEALQHGDTVVVGEAEQVWADVVEDARKGQLKRTYQANERADLTTVPTPNRSLLRRSSYFADVIQTTKGCPFECEFCSVHAYDGQQIRHRTVDQVIREITEIRGSGTTHRKRSFFFADDNIIADKGFARELFTALKPYRLNWSCQASINIAREDELLKLMKESGCGAILVGLESISEANLSAMSKKINLKNDYRDAIRKIQSYEILVHSSFILGYDFDTHDSFDELIAFIEEAELLMPLINILTPFPGTKLFRRFEEAGRITHKDWGKYDTKTIVFTPAGMTPDELMAGYKRVIRHAYSFDTIYRRLNQYWDRDFWRHSNLVDPIPFKYRLLFALRLGTLLFSSNGKRSKFILKILPRIFHKRVRISTILSLMAYNDYAYS